MPVLRPAFLLAYVGRRSESRVPPITSQRSTGHPEDHRYGATPRVPYDSRYHRGSSNPR